MITSGLDPVSALACGAFVSIMIYAALRDLTTRRIGNRLIVLLLAGYVLLAPISGLGLAQMVASVLGAAIVFIAGLVCFSRGWLGGGDVKLASAAALWLGAPLVVPLVVFMTAMGAALTLIWIGWVYLRPGSAALPAELPYGPAIAAASLWLLPVSPWAGGLIQ